MAGQKPKKVLAKPQRLPEKVEQAGWDLAKCLNDDCQSTATRFVFQHLCDNGKKDGHHAKVTWEVPAYIYPKDKKPHEWKCPVCGKKAPGGPVLIKCGACGRVVKVP